MFRIGEHVIHPGQGVCTVTGYEGAAVHTDGKLFSAVFTAVIVRNVCAADP